jgi:2,3-bisphosphoglycerate-independent phosphoglycerate mutase
MANKKKPRAKHKGRGQFEAALEGLGAIEKDVAKVRANLRKFLEQAEKLVSGNEFLITRVTKTSRRKKPPK